LKRGESVSARRGAYLEAQTNCAINKASEEH
jgi:hypothetical protein